MAVEDPASVSVHNKDRMVAGIQEDRVRCFRSNAIQSQKLSAQLGAWLGEHPPQRSSVVRVQIGNKSFEPSRFLPEVSGRTKELFEVCQIDFANAFYIQHAGAA